MKDEKQEKIKKKNMYLKNLFKIEKIGKKGLKKEATMLV